MAFLQLNICEPLNRKWQEIAYGLGFSQNKIENIKAESINNQQKCLQMLGEWLREARNTGGRERNLKSLFVVLITVGHRREAEDLVEQFYKSK